MGGGGGGGGGGGTDLGGKKQGLVLHGIRSQYMPQVEINCMILVQRVILVILTCVCVVAVFVL